MKFNSLKEFWDWLTISTGDIETDHKALMAYMGSKDFRLLAWNEVDLWSFYNSVLLRLAKEQHGLQYTRLGY